MAPRLRLLVPLLLIANVIAFAWWRGTLDPWLAPERQPQRFARQIEPQLLRVIALPEGVTGANAPGPSAPEANAPEASAPEANAPGARPR